MSDRDALTGTARRYSYKNARLHPFWVMFVFFAVVCVTLLLSTSVFAAVSRLCLKCSVLGAQVSLDGTLLGTCPGNFTLEAARHKLTIRLDLADKSYWWYEEAIDFPADDVKTVDATLQLIPAGAWREPTTGMVFVWVPGGEFLMGSNDNVYDFENPWHPVGVDGFWMGRSEVTQGQWKAVMGTNPSHFSACGDDCPVEKVSWDDAQEFIRKLKADSGMAFRLPTEAEWEYAARGVTTRQKWAGTDNEANVGDYAWFLSNSESKTHPVCQKRTNPLGLCDMSGNVWEWCSDWYSGNYYVRSARINPAGPSLGTLRVFRGGSWFFEPWYLRAAGRYRDVPDYRLYDLGFRLAAASGQR